MKSVLPSKEKYISNCDSSEAPTKTAIDNLRSVGISSGNKGYTDGISLPACISTAVSVGATTKSDQVWTKSNSASFLSLLAPGVNINSSVLDTNYAEGSGTSMAAPHVAGAWALLKQKKPTATVTEILEALQNTGTLIQDSRNNIEKPRINIKSALDSIRTGSSCSWATLSNESWITKINPGSGTGNATVTYKVLGKIGSGQRTGTLKVAGQTFTITQTDTIFNDVLLSNPFYNYIMAIYDKGITRGCFQNPLAYCPLRNITRGEMAVFIIRAKEDEPTADYCGTTPPFKDVPVTNNFCRYIKRLKELNITTGCGDGNYCPSRYITRGEMAAFIIRAKYGENFSYEPSQHFSDVPSSHDFFKYVQKMKDEEITTVTGVYNVDGTVTREQMAAFLYRAFLRQSCGG